MKQYLAKRPGILLPALCYGAGIVVLFCFMLGSLIYNRVLYATGALQTLTLSVEDFALEGLLERDGKYITITADPQLLLLDASLRVDTVEIALQGEKEPQMLQVFWAKPGQDYSVRRMAYGTRTEAGARFYLPAGGGYSLRIDPDTAAYNFLDIGDVTLNSPRPWYAFFVPGAAQLLLLAVLPGLVACSLQLLKKRKPGKVVE